MIEEQAEGGVGVVAQEVEQEAEGAVVEQAEGGMVQQQGEGEGAVIEKDN